MSTEIESAVSERLAAKGVAYNVTARGPMTRKDDSAHCGTWECDAWECQFANELGHVEAFEYYTGIGHRAPPRFIPDHVRAMRPGSIGRQNWERANPGRAVAPGPAGVLHSIILDSGAASQSFDSWCGDFGYDTDSRKAEQTYRECQRNADKLARVLGHALITELSKLLEDY